jgi:hypothetical protein
MDDVGCGTKSRKTGFCPPLCSSYIVLEPEGRDDDAVDGASVRRILRAVSQKGP